MKLSAADMTNFPKFAQYLRFRMPEVSRVGVIVNNMKKFGSLSKSQLIHAVGWQTDPLVVITSLSNFECGIQSAYGCFEHGKPGQIEVDVEMVTTFETDPTGSFDNNSRGQGVYVVGATILHELCHWGNFKAGRTEPEEQGLAFERATYGRVIG